MPDISKITLPSGTTYDIKDSVAREMISAGVSFIVAWDGVSAPAAANIPAGVVVSYNSTDTTGTLATSDAQAGAFYLVKSATLPTGEPVDSYDEYVVVKPNTSDSSTWYWEKIGDTKLDLTDVVFDVSLDKKTASVIGANSTFKITQPTVVLETGATAGTGVVEVMTGITSVAASGDNVTALTGLGTPSTTKTIGSAATISVTDPSVALATNATNATGRVEVVTGVNATNTNVKATATNAATAWDNKDTVTAITGYASPTTKTYVETVSSTTKKLVTTSVTGVSGTTSASKASANLNQTTATGDGTASTANTDWLKGVSVSNETLAIGAATLDTQTTSVTFTNVTVPVAATAATTVATGAVADNDTTGAAIVTEAKAGTTSDAITALGTPTTKSAIGASSTFTITQPTITLATGAAATDAGIVSLVNAATPTTTFLGATASGGAATWNSKDEKTVVTGYASPTTDEVIGTASTITATPATTNIKATASGANTAWDNKNAQTALINTTDITVTKGQ